MLVPKTRVLPITLSPIVDCSGQEILTLESHLGHLTVNKVTSQNSVESRPPLIVSKVLHNLGHLERVERIELSSTDWKSVALPLSYTRWPCYLLSLLTSETPSAAKSLTLSRSSGVLISANSRTNFMNASCMFMRRAASSAALMSISSSFRSSTFP